MNRLQLIWRAIFGSPDVIGKLKSELDEHLRAINENTNEIEDNAAYAHQLNEKIEKVSSRIEQIESFVGLEDSNDMVGSLSDREKKVFLTLYTEKEALTYGQISDKTDFPEPLVKQYITNLIEKGVPVSKNYINNKPFIKLNKNFKEVQAKNNVVNLSLESFVEES